MDSFLEVRTVINILDQIDAIIVDSFARSDAVTHCYKVGAVNIILHYEDVSSIEAVLTVQLDMGDHHDLSSFMLTEFGEEPVTQLGYLRKFITDFTLKHYTGRQ